MSAAYPPPAPTRDYPLDRVVERQADALRVERLVACADPIFDEHFPERAVLPGSYVLGTAIAAAGALLDGAPHRAEVTRAVYLRPAAPGDILVVEVRRLAHAGDGPARRTYRFRAVQRHDPRPVAEGVLALTLTAPEAP